jgi:hypothetical protein
MGTAMNGWTVAAIIAAVLGLIWLSTPKNEQELMEYLQRKCERRGGTFYVQDLGKGIQKVCHGVDD